VAVMTLAEAALIRSSICEILQPDWFSEPHGQAPPDNSTAIVKLLPRDSAFCIYSYFRGRHG